MKACKRKPGKIALGLAAGAIDSVLAFGLAASKNWSLGILDSPSGGVELYCTRLGTRS